MDLDMNEKELFMECNFNHMNHAKYMYSFYYQIPNNEKLLDITSKQKCSYTVCGNCIHTVNRTIDSRLRKPLSNCLSSKVTFNVCSKLLWVKYKFFFAQKIYEKKFDYNFLQLST